MAQILPFKAETAFAATEAAPSRPLLGDILVRSGRLGQSDLEAALDLQRGQDAPLGHILIVNGHVTAETLAEAVSEQAELGRIDLDAAPADPRLAEGVDPYACLALEAVPWRVFGGRHVIAVTNPAAHGEAARAQLARAGTRTALIVAAPDAIRRAISRQFGVAMARDAERRCPEALSCRTLIAPRMTLRKGLVLAAIVAGLAAAPHLALQAALAWMLVASLATAGLRLAALAVRFRRGAPEAAGLPRLVDYRRLPRVSVLVPLKGEAAVARELIAALGRMQYPAPLLDVKLVLEAGDTETRAALEASGLPPTVEILTVPPGGVQTKPRAMNYALPFCRGEIVGVYDAEDRPDPGQIRAIVQHLMDAAPDVACVQGVLDFYNTGRNPLSRWFTLDYAVWFRLMLPGIAALGLPVPLGGTTVFFRRRPLEEIGCWDAHNVTEDADLGMRLARFGYRCELVTTVTEEEANCAGPRAWIRQRSRWLKGYAITWGVQMRDPVRLWRELGPQAFLGLQAILLGGLSSFLALPLFWLLWARTFGIGGDLWAGLGPLPQAVIAVTAASEILMLALVFVALRDTKRLRLLPWTLGLGLYWLLGAVAAWRAIAELFTSPFHWHKTEHGEAPRD